MRSVTVYGSWLNIAGTSLTTAFQGGTAVALRGTDELDATIVATGAGGSTITTMDFQLQISDDSVNWDPIQSTRASSGATQATHSITVSAGVALRDHLQTTSHRDAKYTRVAVKYTGGASQAGDAATSSLDYASESLL